MQEPKIPEILKNKLVFGDIDQISALRKYENDHLAFHGDGNIKTYNVHVSVAYEETIQVEAGSQHEAEKKAQTEFDQCGLDFDVSFDAEIETDELDG